jgi:beta-glucosidase
MFKDTATSGYALNMSRDDFSGTFPTLPTDADAVAANITIEGKTVQASLAPYANSNVADDVAPTKNASNGLSLIDMRGSDYDDPAWDVFLNQMTDDDYTNAANYICNNAYNTPAITSLGKPATVDHDGPAGFTSLFGSLGNCAWMSEVVMASTWNQDLAKEMGECIGDEALMGDGTSTFAGWYGPAMNTHRSAFAGRNFEYYSENGVLGGYIGASVVSGAADKGCYAYIKHFALNDQEYCRTVNVCTWANEQAIREIYLKPFEITVKKATATESYISDSKGTMSTKTIQACQGVMTSFNRVGTTWAGGSKALCTNVLRNEWGFRGVGISDFNLYNYMVPDQGMRAGTDMQLTWASFKDQTFNDLNTATEQLAIRNAVKNVCFSVSNSLAMNGVVPGSIITYTRAPWEWWIIGGDIALSVLVLAGAGWVTYRTLKYKKEGGDEGHAEPSESKAA